MKASNLREVLLLGLFLGLFLPRTFSRVNNPDWVVTFFDVGQGDAALIQAPGGKTLLVDSGGGGDSTERKSYLADELTRMGVLRLDDAILSHPDLDHGGGFRALSSWMGIRNLWFNSYLFDIEPRPLFYQLKWKMEALGTSLHPVKTETSVTGFPGSRLIPLFSSKYTTNDSCLVMELRVGRCRILFTGDIEKEGEESLLKRIGGPITILKIAHHGSKTSSQSAFLNRVSPRWGVISVGAWNRYGHPHPKVLERFKSRGIDILRTDFHGFIRFKLHANSTATCETAQGPCGTFSCNE